ncbi:hypothetical protein A3A21_02520 [Candidatus Jorgensenbacteria bacterium RIFCSPLOWO2_01_FULL_45_25b]|uniref:Uncharacterized protein n=1 Tax=Candidatus Jorgensenbacteria bacterium RIFCSPLOWO2_01_FULL_45_25b TaxID=1798471 RepID=A0A1F6BTF5_9BACT|nr:MAG: hypothetical protein A3A21_02520 [Candidatus Jorgensenbacteria bacterium RIFCSPLOWO2_01_FULL_45_25b]
MIKRFIFTVAVFFSSVSLSFAANATQHETPPGLGETDFLKTITELYSFAQGLGVALAVGVIVIGGIYIGVSGAVDKKKEGKDMITSAILGLILLFGAHLILRTINPQLVTLTLPELEKPEKNPECTKESTLQEFISVDVKNQDGSIEAEQQKNPEYKPGGLKPCGRGEAPVAITGGKQICQCYIPEPEVCPGKAIEGCPKFEDFIKGENASGKHILCEKKFFCSTPDFKEWVKEGMTVFKYPFYYVAGKELPLPSGIDYLTRNTDPPAAGVENAQCLIYAFNRVEDDDGKIKQKIYPKSNNFGAWLPCVAPDGVEQPEGEEKTETQGEGGNRNVTNDNCPASQKATVEEINAQMALVGLDTGIPISSSCGKGAGGGACIDQQYAGCTSLTGLPKSTAKNLNKIYSGCLQESGCSFIITGGTEVGHNAHGPDRPVVDLGWNDALAKLLTKKRSSDALAIKRFYQITKICTTPEDKEYRFNCNYDEKIRHLHVEFKL